MAQAILVDEQINPGLEMVRMFDRYMPVKVAFWAQELDRSGGPTLYIASDEYDHTKFDAAFTEAFRLVDQVGGYGLDPMRVRIIPGDDRRVADAIAHRDAQVGSRPRAWGRLRVGGQTVDDFYVYPPLTAPPSPQPETVAAVAEDR